MTADETPEFPLAPAMKPERPRDEFGRPLPEGSENRMELPWFDEMTLEECHAEAIRLFDAGNYFAAHEAWETCWNYAKGTDEVEFFKGLAQLGAGYTHWMRGNPHGVVALLGRAIERIGDRGSPYRGLDIDAFLDRIEALRGVAQRCEQARTPLPSLDREPIPRAAQPERILRSSLAFESLVGWNEIAEAHRTAVPDVWKVVEAFLTLHLDAVAYLSLGAGQRPVRTDEAVLVIATHAANVFVSGAGLVGRGRFDVGQYLVRPLFDLAFMTYAAATDSTVAHRFFENHKIAVDSRKAFLARLRALGDDLTADELDQRFQETADAVNTLAHAGPFHARRLIERHADGQRPSLIGFADAAQSSELLKAFLETEFWVMVCLEAARGFWFPPEWHRGWSDAQTLWAQMMTDHGHRLG